MTTEETIARLERDLQESEGKGEHLSFRLAEKDQYIEYLERQLDEAGVIYDQKWSGE